MAQPLTEVVEQFCNFQRKQRGKTEGGVKAYRWNLEQLLMFVRNREGRLAKVTDLTASTVQAWMDDMAAEDLALSTSGAGTRRRRPGHDHGGERPARCHRGRSPRSAELPRWRSDARADPPQAPRAVQVMNAERGYGFAPHARVAQDQEDRHVTRASTCLRGLHERVHDRRPGHLLRRFAMVRRPLQCRHRVGGQHFALHQPGAEARHGRLPNPHRTDEPLHEGILPRTLGCGDHLTVSSCTRTSSGRSSDTLRKSNRTRRCSGRAGGAAVSARRGPR